MFNFNLSLRSKISVSKIAYFVLDLNLGHTTDMHFINFIVQ